MFLRRGGDGSKCALPVARSRWTFADGTVVDEKMSEAKAKMFESLVDSLDAKELTALEVLIREAKISKSAKEIVIKEINKDEKK